MTITIKDPSPIQEWITLIQKFLKEFGWLADSFIVDFFQDCHWTTHLPPSWQEYLPSLSPLDLADVLDFRIDHPWKHSQAQGPINVNVIPPLSLMAFRSATKLLSLDRRNYSVSEVKQNKNDAFLTRHIKPKKIHEITRFSNLVSKISEKTCTKRVVDVGSGLGHLSRYLTYGCGLELTCIDCNGEFGETAGKLDTQLESFLVKKTPEVLEVTPPQHICMKLSKEEELQKEVNENYGLIGLHSCGNLAPLIIRNYARNKTVQFLVSVGCCYMKLDENAFPMSNYCEGVKLSYEALEVSCHAVEKYCETLRHGDAHVRKLMVHAYRAALETILVRKFGIKRAGLRGVKNCEKLSFIEYAQQATKNAPQLNLSLTDFEDEETIQNMLQDWFKVVLFFSLRLLVANVVETLVILDRALFVKENGLDVEIVTLFDPILSPRGFGVVSWR